MEKRYYVVLCDVISSRRIKDKRTFQKKLETTCTMVNATYSGSIHAGFKILKGIDEIEGVLSNISNIYEIIAMILEQLYPDSMRFVLVQDSVDIGVESRDTAKMDGPAFHKASDLMEDLKKSKLMFGMFTGYELTDTLIAGEINLILLLKKNWSAKQHRIMREYRKTGNQNEVAKALGITQQAVSKVLTRSMWKEIGGIEERLIHVLHQMTVRT